MAKDFKSFLLRNKIVLNGIERVKNIPWFLGTHAFSVVLVLVLLSILLGAFLFYEYVSLAEITFPETYAVASKFQEKSYQAVLNEWQKRDNIFLNPIEENLADPFQQ
jgi:hypothetical protein